MVRQIREINPTSSALPRWFTVLGPWLYFAADDGSGAGWGNHELWRSDGTTAGTVLVREIAPPPARASNPGQQTHAAFQGNVYVSASDGVSQPLWRSNGTASGTFIVNITFPSVVPNSLTVAGDQLYIAFGGGAPDSYLYRYDGIDLVPIRRSTNPWEWGFNPFDPTALGGNLYFTENFGNELWRTNGSTIAVRVPDPAAPPNDIPRSKRNLTAVGDTLFFAAQAGGPGGKELWKYTPGDATTSRVSVIGTGYYPAELTAVGHRLFFVGDDSQGAELWVSDGSALGTRRVLDINPTAGASAPGPRRGPTQLTAVSEETVYFSANDGSTGYELWKSDGSASGTSRVMDLNPGPGDSHPKDLIVRGNILYFTASDSFNGRQLWATDTLSNTTTRLTSAAMFGPTTQFSVQDRGNDRNLAIAGETVFFSATFREGSSISGYELWGLDLPPLVSLRLPPGGDGEPLSEDGPRALPILFHRTGDTSTALTVSFQVGGTARPGDDYRVREATSFTSTGGSITFAAGASTAILLLDPSSDGVREGNETVSLSLTSGAGYAVDSAAAVLATLVDNDTAPGQVAGTPIPARLAAGSAFEHRNAFAFAAIKRDGSVVTWGDANTGGNSTAVAARLSSGVIRVFSTASAFAALKSDGSVVPWGDPLFGGDAGAVAGALSFGVTEIASTAFAFAALKDGGSVITWGDSGLGNFGGDSGAVRDLLASGVQRIFASRGAFAALKSDGSVVPWGDAAFGGVSGAAASRLASGVVTITPGEAAFAALKSDGSVVAWGDPGLGGSISPSVATRLTSGVVRVASNPHAFAALKSDGSVITWGDSSYGGDSGAVADLLSSGVEQILSTTWSFAALKSDGSVVTWGGPYGPPSFGIPDPSVALQLSSGVERLFATNQVFAALKRDGSVVAWGNPLIGGRTGAAQARLNSGVIDIVTSDDAFAALKSDGSVVTWGWTPSGGDSSAVASQLSAGVTRIFSNGRAFSALKTDGSVVTWGDPARGGSVSGATASQLSAGVVAFASPLHDDRLVQLPGVSLSAEPTSVPEDGSNNLRFTFLRSGPTSDPLTVWFDLSGGLRPATFGSDFTQTGATPQAPPLPWSLTFAAGSSTAVLELDPVADSAYEGDESVTLNLLPGADYLIAGASSATGVITNDDPFLNPSTLRRLTSRFGDTTLNPRLFSVAGDRLYFQANAGSPNFNLFWSEGSAIVPTGVREAMWSPDPGVTYDSTDRAGLGDALFFNGYNTASGWELWRDDGGSQTLFKDFLPGFSDPDISGSSYGPSHLTRVGDTLFFRAPILRTEDRNGDGLIDSTFYDAHLWRSDGTTAGTVPLLSLPAFQMFHAIAAGSYFYFSTPDVTWRTLGLWRSDGTAAGTIPLTTTTDGAPLVWSTAGNRLFFAAIDELHGAELWISDGTVAGTRLVKDILPGTGSSGIGAGPRGLAVIGDILYFRANDGLHGDELWRSDGTAAGTRMVADLQPGPGGSNLYWFASVGNTLFFSNGAHLWKSDGTTAGTVPVVASSDGPNSPEWLTAIGSTLYFTAQAPSSSSMSTPRGRQIWKSDGTAAGTVMVADLQLSAGSNTPHNLMVVDDTLFFVAYNSSGTGTELWSLDVSAELPRYTTIEAQGNTKLLRRGDGVAFSQAGSGPRQQITSPWGVTIGSDSTEWQVLAVDTLSGVNRLLWRNNTANFLHTWSLDANWNWTSSSGTHFFSSPAAWELEEQFQVDANRDSIIGTPYTTLEAQGNARLVRRGDGVAFAQAGLGAALKEITSPWGVTIGSDSTEWQIIAVETLSGVNRLLWRNNAANFLHTWTLDANWNWTSSSGTHFFSSPAARELEEQFQVDANRNGMIGT